MGTIIKDAEVKALSNFGAFFSINNGEIDSLVHLAEISYSRVNHPDEVLTVGERHDLLVISCDTKKQQLGCSIKGLSIDCLLYTSPSPRDS